MRASAPDDRTPHSYFVFADGRLLRVDAGSTQAEPVAEVPDVKGKELEIRLYVHGPWVCVTERFGVTLINTATGAVRGLSRADHHADVSSYSIGFLDRDGRTLLVVQTEWNRLDVFDAETGANLTERDESKHIDYFHSMLHVSPDSRADQHDGQHGLRVQLGRPCTFVDDRYRQLAFFTIPDQPWADTEDRFLEPTRFVDCDVFPRNQYGEVKVFYRWVDGTGVEERALPGQGRAVPSAV